MPLPSNFVIHNVVQLDPIALESLRVASLAEGFKVVQRLMADWQTGANCFQADGEGFWAAYVDTGRLVGIAGLNRDPYSVATNGRVRHLYVLPAYRRMGIARQLVTTVIEAARSHFSQLVLRTFSPDAMRFYATLGFQPAEHLPDSSHYLVL